MEQHSVKFCNCYYLGFFWAETNWYNQLAEQDQSSQLPSSWRNTSAGQRRTNLGGTKTYVIQIISYESLLTFDFWLVFLKITPPIAVHPHREGLSPETTGAFISRNVSSRQSNSESFSSTHNFTYFARLYFSPKICFLHFLYFINSCFDASLDGRETPPLEEPPSQEKNSPLQPSTLGKNNYHWNYITVNISLLIVWFLIYLLPFLATKADKTIEIRPSKHRNAPREL